MPHGGVARNVPILADIVCSQRRDEFLRVASRRSLMKLRALTVEKTLICRGDYALDHLVGRRPMQHSGSGMTALRSRRRWLSEKPTKNKDDVIRMGLTPEQESAITAAAARDGLELSAWYDSWRFTRRASCQKWSR